jgi:hypothetical protein
MDETTITVRSMAALRLDDPVPSLWIDQYTIDHPAYNALLAAVRIGESVACSFRREVIILWLPIKHERYAVIGHMYQGKAYYAIPHDAIIPC